MQLGDGLGGVGHRDHRHRLEPVAQPVEHLHGVAVERAREDRPQLRRRRQSGEEPVGGVQDGVVEAELVEPLVQQRWNRACRAVERVAGRDRPPAGPEDAAPPPLFPWGELEHPGPAAHHLVQTLRGVLTGEVHNVVAHERHELDLVAVGVDHGMVELLPNPRDLVGRDELGAHGSSCVRAPLFTRWSSTRDPEHFGTRRIFATAGPYRREA